MLIMCEYVESVVPQPNGPKWAFKMDDLFIFHKVDRKPRTRRPLKLEL